MLEQLKAEDFMTIRNRTEARQNISSSSAKYLSPSSALVISGGLNSGDPTTVWVSKFFRSELSLVLQEQPKSAIFRLKFLSINKFSVLISRCPISFKCKYSSPNQITKKMHKNEPSTN